MIHDAFQPLSYWNGFMQAPEYDGVILDTHVYQVFSNEVRIIVARLLVFPKLIRELAFVLR